jgi:hypothetical protein
MPRRALTALVCLVGGASLAVGCSLATSFDGLRDGAGEAGASADGGAREDVAAIDGSSDARSDAATADSADGAPKYAFADTFDRPDTLTGLGNGWVTKTPSLRVSQNRALRFLSGVREDYRNNVTFRPATEAVRDVEVSTDVHFTVAMPFPQVHARVQPGSALSPDTLDCYILFLQDNSGSSPVFKIVRQRGADFHVLLTQFSGPTKLTASDVIRLKLRVQGSAPVVLSASVEIQALGGFMPFASGGTVDTSEERIETPGVVGLSAEGESSGAFAYDNFVATEL